MTTRVRATLLVFVLWTAFVWVNRISNTLRSTTESSGSKTFSTVLSIVVLAFALGVVVALVRGWSSGLDRTGGRLLVAAAVVTVIVWLVRVPQILTADHAAGFKVVHVALGVISVVLAALVWQAGIAAMRAAAVTAPDGGANDLRRG